tara:strand:- start:2266 stop:2481 length:216 start_codon:yes stop_codon:yes gene_type:complete
MTKSTNKNNMTKFFQSLSEEELQSWIKNMDTPLNSFLDAYKHNRANAPQNVSEANMIIAKRVLKERKKDEK